MTSRAGVIRQVADILADRCPGHACRVGIDGICGVGKSTFARDLVNELTSRGRVAVHLDSDGFHHVRERRYRQGRTSARGYYEDAYDFDSLIGEVLRPLGHGGSAEYASRVHDLASDRVVHDEHAIAPADAIIIFDATFIHVPRLTGWWDETVYLHSDETTAMARGIRRDAPTLGGESAARAAYESRYIAAWRIYEAEQSPREHASIVIDHTHVDAPTIERLPA